MVNLCDAGGLRRGSIDVKLKHIEISRNWFEGGVGGAQARVCGSGRTDAPQCHMPVQAMVEAGGGASSAAVSIGSLESSRVAFQVP